MRAAELPLNEHGRRSADAVGHAACLAVLCALRLEAMQTDARIAAWAVTDGDKSWKSVDDVLRASADGLPSAVLGPVWLAWGAILSRLVRRRPHPDALSWDGCSPRARRGLNQHVYEREILPADYTRPRPRQLDQLRGRPANAPGAPTADPADAVHRLLAAAGTEVAQAYVKLANRAGAVTWLAAALEPARLPPLEVSHAREERACFMHLGTTRPPSRAH